MSPAIAFWMHSGLEHPLTCTAITQSAQEPLADMCNHNCRSASALIPFFLPFYILFGQTGGINPMAVWAWEHFALPMPWAKQGRSQLRVSPEAWPKAAITEQSGKTRHGNPDFFCHKGGPLWQVQTLAAEPRWVNEMTSGHERAEWELLLGRTV